MKRLHVLAFAALATAFASTSQAAVFRFSADPFAGSNASDPGRQIIGGERFIETFDLANDVISIGGETFNVFSPISVFNGFASDLPEDGANFVVLNDLDADGDAGNGVLMNAGLAANLIADRVTRAGAGFFIYHNSVLKLNRLVFSTDLSDRNADLKVIARFLDQGEPAGVDALPEWGDQLISAVPEPSTWAMMILGFGIVGAAARRTRRPLVVAT